MNTWDPFDTLSPAPLLQLNSDGFKDQDELPLAQISAMANPKGGDLSPQLTWSDEPSTTKSFAVTVFDPDAPTGSGFWHLAMYNIPADIKNLAEGAASPSGISNELIQRGVKVLRNDGGVPGYVGAAPPPGHGTHRYMYTIHALDVPTIDIGDDSSPALLGFNMHGHTVARARITGVFGH